MATIVMRHEVGEETASRSRRYWRQDLGAVFDEEPAKEPDPGLFHIFNLVSDFARRQRRCGHQHPQKPFSLPSRIGYGSRMSRRGSMQMATTLIDVLEARLATEGWTIRDTQLNSLAGVLPGTVGMPEASVVTDNEAAFVLGDTLLVAAWDENDAHLTTELFSLLATPLTIVWNADWLSDYGPSGSDDVPDDRPMTVTVSAPNGNTYVLPFDEAWSNPVGCINFAAKLIEKAHGFRPRIGTGNQGSEHRPWKR